MIIGSVTVAINPWTALQGLLLRLKLMKPSTKHFSILDGVSATIPPGRVTLLLGPPGAGKSTLLAALAGKLQSTNLKVSLQRWNYRRLYYDGQEEGTSGKDPSRGAPRGASPPRITEALPALAELLLF